MSKTSRAAFPGGFEGMPLAYSDSNVALYPETLPGGVSGCPMAIIVVHFLSMRFSNPTQNTRHDFRLL
jgi:hypothetical protein